MEHQFLTVKAVANYLNVHTDTIYALVRENEIPHFRIRSKILFSQVAIDNWIYEQQAN
ncbi:helix-turn-helix domain-containing protein [Aquibacillus sediminis]|uniref:helix-turn-helix domain-containing protein n=1 Tax=Aquibacillus sediminis TaxID=2574734 RepID=UPI001107DF95|nr:helix-turn-helix domain-containing protein [Aquibacillus sediminis]